jgi:LemA protein
MALSTTTLTVIGLLGIYLWYANLIRKRNKTQEALSSIDIHLKKRANLIPNILKIAKKFMEHEKMLFTEVTRLREKLLEDYDQKDVNAVKEHFQAAAKLSEQMNSFMLKAENYPDLTSSQNMLHAQETYNEIEAQIAAARRFYNSAVNELKNSIDIFPGNLIAMLARVKIMPFYEADTAAKKPINIDDFLN